MADPADFAYHPPGGAAYDTNIDPTMTRPPPNANAETHDELRDQSRLSGARGLPNLKERGA